MFGRNRESEESKGIPPCLVDAADHRFDSRGICNACGASHLEMGGWGSFNLRSCSNEACRTIIATLARECPHCGQQQSMNAKSRLFQLYVFTGLPFVRNIVRPREEDVSVAGMIFLFIGLIIGVLFGKAIRKQGSIGYEKMDIAIAIGMSFVLLPTVFKNAVFQAKSPLIVRFGLCIQQGAFSDLLIEGIEQGIVDHGTTP